MLAVSLAFLRVCAVNGHEVGSCNTISDQIIGSHSSTYTNLVAKTVAVCCAACQADAKCASFTFEPPRSNYNNCFLKTDTVVVGGHSGAISGYSSSGPMPAPSPAPTPVPAPTPAPGTCQIVRDLIIGTKANTYTNSVTKTAAECCAACQGDAKCQAFTFEPPNSGSNCFLKSDALVGEGRSGAISGYRGPAPAPPSAITVSFGGRVGVVDPGFKCWNIDASPDRQWETRNLTDAKLKYLAKQSLPGYLRFGGAGNDGLRYFPCNGNGHCMTQRHFDDLMTFARDATAKIVFGLNILVRKGKRWDPTEAKRLIKYAQSKNYQFFGFELGNEQNYHYTADAEAADFAILANLLVELYPDAAVRPKILGPDIHGFHTGPDKNFVKFLHEFVQECQRIGVPLHGVTHHEYIEVSQYSKIPPPASMLDITKAIAVGVNASLSEFGVQIWAGEIGPHNGKSPGCDHTSLRWANFADSFWYLDAMATKAANGYSVFCRQDFVGIDYGMLDCATYDPLPDYYAGVLWSQLMGTNVLQATSSDASHVRAYAHCSAKSSDDVTVLLLNLAPVAINVTLNMSATSYTEYLLTGPDGTDGQAMALNGQHLNLSSTGKLPSLLGHDVGNPRGPLTLPAASILFVEMHGAGCPMSSRNMMVV